MIEKRSVCESRNAIKRTSVDGWPMPVIAHITKNENARPSGWKSRPAPGPKAKPASVCATPASVAFSRPPSRHRQRKEQHHPDRHDDALEDVGPDRREKSAVGRVGDHGRGEDDQSEQIARIGRCDQLFASTTQSAALRGEHDLHDPAPALNCGDEVRGQKSHHQQAREQPERRGCRTARERGRVT